MKNNIQIEVLPEYLSKESIPKLKYFVFSYKITISNNGDIASTLIDRHWYITDALGKLEEVIGYGVIGEQPRIKPNYSYTYTSGLILNTPTGAMRGFYGMVNDNKEHFKAEVPEFALLGPVTFH